MVEPVYFLTFRTYGTWLHGDERGSVDRNNKDFGEPLTARNDALKRRRQSAMKNAPCLLDTSDRRRAVEAAMERTCAHRGWNLLALNVRTNHVHVVLVASVEKERVLADLKAWATRALREAGLADRYTDVWSHHGSTRVLTTEEAVEGAIQYTLYEQGPPLE